MSKLRKSFPEWYNPTYGAIFKTMASRPAASTDFPWLDKASLLDIEYIGNHSGDKTVSPLIDKFIEDNSVLTNPFILTSDQRIVLADILLTKYRNKWSRLYAVESAEYNPIENYSMVEEETPDISRRRQVSNDYEERDVKSFDRDITREERATDDFSETDTTTTKTDYTVSTDTETASDIYGFNSNSPVPSNEANGNSTVHTTGAENDNVVTTGREKVGGMISTETADGDANKETNVHTQAGYVEETETGTRELTRSGNIGVTTSQQMLESEIALWEWNFYETVFNDVDSVLTIPVYQIFNKGVYK